MEKLLEKQSRLQEQIEEAVDADWLRQEIRTMGETMADVLRAEGRKVGRKEGLEGEDSVRRRGPEKKTVKKPQLSSSRSERGGKGGIVMVPRPKPAIGAGSSAKRGTIQDSNDDEDESG